MGDTLDCFDAGAAEDAPISFSFFKDAIVSNQSAFNVPAATTATSAPAVVDAMSLPPIRNLIDPQLTDTAPVKSSGLLVPSTRSEAAPPAEQDQPSFASSLFRFIDEQLPAETDFKFTPGLTSTPRLGKVVLVDANATREDSPGALSSTTKQPEAQVIQAAPAIGEVAKVTPSPETDPLATVITGHRAPGIIPGGNVFHASAYGMPRAYPPALFPPNHPYWNQFRTAQGNFAHSNATANDVNPAYPQVNYQPNYTPQAPMPYGFVEPPRQAMHPHQAPLYWPYPHSNYFGGLGLSAAYGQYPQHPIAANNAMQQVSQQAKNVRPAVDQRKTDSSGSRPGPLTRPPLKSGHEPKRNVGPVRGKGKFAREAAKIDYERPWVRVNDREGKNNRGGKLNQYRASDHYQRVPNLPSWRAGKHKFDYNADGELSRDAYSAAEIEAFLCGHDELHEQEHGKLRVWIQKTPADSARRYPHPQSSHCRFKECPLRQIRRLPTILQGHLRVAFDEKYSKHGKSRGIPPPDPFAVAGYAHLYCFERFLDVPAIAERVEIQVDTRILETEPNGIFPARLDRTDPRFIAAVKLAGQGPTKGATGKLTRFPSTYPRHADYKTGAAKPHERTLSHAMQVAYVQSWTATKTRVMAQRGSATALSATYGDLEKLISAKWPSAATTANRVDNSVALQLTSSRGQHFRKRKYSCSSSASESGSMSDLGDDSSSEDDDEKGKFAASAAKARGKKRKIEDTNGTDDNKSDAETSSSKRRRSSRLCSQQHAP